MTSVTTTSSGPFLHWDSMQESFPKIDLRGKDDAAYYFDQIRRHALKLVQRELEKDKLGKDKEAFSICNKAIDEVCIFQREMI